MKAFSNVHDLKELPETWNNIILNPLYRDLGKVEVVYCQRMR